MIQYFLACIKAYFPISAVCSKCDLETVYSGLMWIRTKRFKDISYQYQCQNCGKLEYSNEFSTDGNIVALRNRCECKGQYRRDKNIFCPGCHHRKTIENKPEEFLNLTDYELELLEEIHGEKTNKNSK